MNGFTLISFIITLAAHATTFVNRPLAETVNEAPNVVRGRTLDSYFDWDPKHERVFTYTQLNVTEVLKGDIKAARITLRSPGGTKDGIEMHVPGAAQFNSDEDVVLLLGPHNKDDDSYDIPGFATGKYNVVKGPNGEPILKNSLGSAAIFDRNKDPKTLSYTSAVSLEVFRRVAKGEDVPEAAHSQFRESAQPAPPGAYEAGHRDLTVQQLPAPKPAHPSASPTAKVAETHEHQENEDAHVEAPKAGSGIWVPLSAALLVAGLAALAWWVLRSKNGGGG